MLPIVSFDYDWTLVYAQPLTIEVFYNVLQEKGFSVTLNEIKRAFIKFETHVPNKYLRIKNTLKILSERDNLYIIAYYVERLKLLKIFEITNGENITSNELSELERIGEEILRTGRSVQQPRLYDDVIPLIEELHEKDTRLFIVSANNNERISKILKKYEMFDHFEDIITPDKTNLNKEENFKFLLERRSSNEPIVHIGDDYSSDGIAAQEFGINPVIIRRANHFLFNRVDNGLISSNVPLIQNFQELRNILRTKYNLV